MKKNLESEGESPSISSIVGSLLGDIQRLVRQELAILERDLSENIRKQRRGIGLAFFSGITLFLAVGWISLSLTYLLNEVANLPFWLSLGVVGILLMFLGGYVARQWLLFNKEEADGRPRKTGAGHREDARSNRAQTESR